MLSLTKLLAPDVEDELEEELAELLEVAAVLASAEGLDVAIVVMM